MAGAVEDLEATVVALGTSNLKEEKREEKRKEPRKLIKEIKGTKEVKKVVTKEPKVPELPAVNPLYPTFSDAVKIVYEEGRGRFAVAGREVIHTLLKTQIDKLSQQGWDLSCRTVSDDILYPF
mgnify:CR=1 FL=1